MALDATKRPARRIAQLLEPLAGDDDLVVLDCPPSVSLRTFDQLPDGPVAVSRRPPQVVAFLSMVDRRRRQHREVVAELPDLRPQIAPLVIPAAAVVEQMGVQRAPVPAFAPRSAAAAAYAAWWELLGGRLAGGA